MAFIQYLNFDGESLPLPTSYDLDYTDVEADSSGETEAGTKQRDLIRIGVVNIEVSFQTSSKWLAKLTAYRNKPRIMVRYFDTETLEIKQTQMFMEGYRSSLVKDTSFKGLWKVSFTLKEF